MLQFPRWRVDVTVGGDLVKTFYETATTAAAAIGKAKHKMRGAVSSAGAFKFKATKTEAGGSHHSTKKSTARIEREIGESLTKLPPGEAAAWAHKFFSGAGTPEELTELRRVMLNPWTGAGRYFDTRTGIAKSEIDTVYQQHRERVGTARRAHSTKSRSSTGHGRELEYADAEIKQMFHSGGSNGGDNAKIAILGDPMYVQRFKMPKWNIKPSVLDTPDVAIRHRAELGIPTSKHAHRLRADYLRELRKRFQSEHQRLVNAAERAYGKEGPLISGGLRENWPSDVKDRIRFVAQGDGTLSEAVRLHETLSKTRSPAFS